MANTTIPATSDRAARMNRSELVAQVDEGWRSFREAVRHIGRAKMDQQTGAGWSYHHLVAHAAGWHDLTARRLRALRATRSLPGPDDAAALGLPVFDAAIKSNATL